MEFAHPPSIYFFFLFLQPSICTLYPPHYDAVSSLASYKELLFSSCGVTIKQWDCKERSLKQVGIRTILGILITGIFLGC